MSTSLWHVYEGGHDDPVLILMTSTSCTYRYKAEMTKQSKMEGRSDLLFLGKCNFFQIWQNSRLWRPRRWWWRRRRRAPAAATNCKKRKRAASNCAKEGGGRQTAEGGEGREHTILHNKEAADDDKKLTSLCGQQ